MSTRSAIRRFARSLGYDIAKKGHVPHWGNFFDQIDRHKMTPRQIFDVGVGYGTPELYRRFPESQLFLFDPSPGSAPHASKIAKNRPGANFYPIALGAANGEASLILHGDNFEASSFFAGSGEIMTSTCNVSVKRFDSIVKQIMSPSLCKIDAQGYEIEVIKGMGELAAEIDFYIIETALQNSKSNAPEFSDLQTLMTGLGFCLFEIGGFIRRPRDFALAQIDVIYVKNNSPLRGDRRWLVTT